jgi:hypothetical protein
MRAARLAIEIPHAPNTTKSALRQAVTPGAFGRCARAETEVVDIERLRAEEELESIRSIRFD